MHSSAGAVATLTDGRPRRRVALGVAQVRLVDTNPHVAPQPAPLLLRHLVVRGGCPTEQVGGAGHVGIASGIRFAEVG